MAGSNHESRRPMARVAPPTREMVSIAFLACVMAWVSFRLAASRWTKYVMVRPAANIRPRTVVNVLAVVSMTLAASRMVVLYMRIPSRMMAANHREYRVICP